MKKLFIVLAASTALYSCVDNPEGKKAETKDSVSAATTTAAGTGLKVDAAASNIVWLGNKVSGKHTGTIRISDGTLAVQDGKLTGGKFTVDMTSIANTDITDTSYKAKLEGHLKSPDFFDVTNHPTATFEITSVKEAGPNKVNISGNLTIRGISKNITFDADVVESTATSVKAKADFNINRHDWGITYPGMKDDAISQEINLKVDLQAKG